VFDWLVKNAKYFGFCMTYHRDNKYGFMFEPWHWALKE
jgi:D-alanyl-D-alanine carboxypeptidase